MSGREEGVSLPEILVATLLVGLAIVPLLQIYPRTLVSDVSNVNMVLSTAAIRKAEEVITIARAAPVAFNASARANTTSSSGATSTSASITIGASANYIVILIGISGTTGVSSVRVGTANASQIRALTLGASYRSEVWGLLNPPTGTQTVTVTMASSVGHSWVAAAFKGVLSATPLGGNNGNTGISTAPAVTMSPRTANSMLLGGFVLAASGVTITQGTASQVAINTAVTTRLSTNISTHLAMETNPGDVGTGMTWTVSTSASWVVLAVELRGTVTTGALNGTATCTDLPNCRLAWTTTTELSSSVPGAGALKDVYVVACQDLNGNGACDSGEPQVRYDTKITAHP